MIVCLLALFCCMQSSTAQNHGKLIIKFKAIANGRPMLQQDSSYVNAFNERYEVTRLKFYISNPGISGTDLGFQHKEVFLLDAFNCDSLVMQVPEGSFYNLSFTMGVDSAFNCSGAQDGALDPLNGMFWTWNTGYIFFKMEGFSPASSADLHRIEQHIGGYRSNHNAARRIHLTLPATMEITNGKTRYIEISLNLDKYFSASHKVSIAEQPLIMTPGNAAMKAADNIAQMFSIETPR